MGGYEELRPARRGERGSDSELWSVLWSVLRLDGGTAGAVALGAAPLVGAAGTAPAPAPSVAVPVAVPVAEAAGLVPFGLADEVVRVAGAGVVGVASAAPSASWWVVCCCAARTSARKPLSQAASSAT